MGERILVLVRHGESEWNLKNLFTGWRDIDLTENGIKEARAAGRKPRAASQRPDRRKHGRAADERGRQQEERRGHGAGKNATVFLLVHEPLLTQGGPQDTLLIPTS